MGSSSAPPTASLHQQDLPPICGAVPRHSSAVVLSNFSPSFPFPDLATALHNIRTLFRNEAECTFADPAPREGARDDGTALLSPHHSSLPSAVRSLGQAVRTSYSRYFVQPTQGTFFEVEQLSWLIVPMYRKDRLVNINIHHEGSEIN